MSLIRKEKFRRSAIATSGQREVSSAAGVPTRREPYRLPPITHAHAKFRQGIGTPRPGVRRMRLISPSAALLSNGCGLGLEDLTDPPAAGASGGYYEIGPPSATNRRLPGPPSRFADGSHCSPWRQ